MGAGQETQRSHEIVGLVPPSVSVVVNLPAVPKKTPRMLNIQRWATRPLEIKAHALTATPTFSPPTVLALEPSCLIKSISCASAVPHQMTFKQVLLFGGEQMGVGSRIYFEKRPQFFHLDNVAVSDLCPESAQEAADVYEMRLSRWFRWEAALRDICWGGKQFHLLFVPLSLVNLWS